jgi:hypothetical protein
MDMDWQVIGVTSYIKRREENSDCKFEIRTDFRSISCNRVSEQRNILHEIRKRKANWIGHIVRRNCLLKQVIEGKIRGG